MKGKNTDSFNKEFAAILLRWNREKNKRDMPWKGEKDAYKIWLSEIILQQTRVEQGLQYYKNFIRVFPDVHKLAKAPDNKVFKLWEGLGYYSRCRNLLASARIISKEHKGKFPDTYESIKNLKGVGPYTAAAISSFAFNLPHAVVDGNVFRVIARVFGIAKPTDTTEGKKFFASLAEELLDKNQPGIYNQAIMDFGATICKPQSPLCEECVFQKQCFAFNHDTINELPVKEKKISIRQRFFYYLILQCGDEWLIKERTEKDIWQQLFEFPLLETKEEKEVKVLLASSAAKKILQTKKYSVLKVTSVQKQQLSHQLITGRFIHIQMKEKPTISGNGIWISKQKFKKYPFPRFITQYLQEHFAEKK